MFYETKTETKASNLNDLEIRFQQKTNFKEALTTAHSVDSFENDEMHPAKSTPSPEEKYRESKMKVQSYNERGNVSYKNFEYSIALKYFKRALRWSYKMHSSVKETTPSDQIRDDEVPESLFYEQIEKEKKSIAYTTKTLTNIAKTHRNRQELEDARRCFRQARDILMSPPMLYQSNHDKIKSIEDALSSINNIEYNLKTSFESLRLHAKSLEGKGNYVKAMETYKFYLSKLQEVVGRVNPVVSETLHKIGVMHWKLGNYNDALNVLSDSLKILILCFGESHPESSETLSSIGLVHLSKAEYSNAMKFYQVALRIKRDSLGMHHPAVARIMMRIGMVYSEEGRLNEAMSMYRDGLKIQKSALKLQEEEADRFDAESKHEDESPPSLDKNTLCLEIAATLNSLGIVHEKKAEYSAAMNSYKEALSLYRRALGGDDHVDVAVTLSNCGQAYRHLGQYDRAMDMYKRSLKIMKSSLGETHRNVGSTLQNIGVLYSIMGNFDKALELYREAYQIQKMSLGEEHPDVAVTLSDMGDIYEKLGDFGQLESNEVTNTIYDVESYRQDKYRKAAKLFKRALCIRRAAMGNDHYYVGLTLHKLAMFYNSKICCPNKALSRFQETIRIYRLNNVDETEHHYIQAAEILEELRSRKAAALNHCKSPSSSSISSVPSMYRTGSESQCSSFS